MSRYLPDDNLGYPVLIKVENITGSGFFLNNDEKELYFVTAKHVLNDYTSDKKATLLAYGKDLNKHEPVILELDFNQLNQGGHIIRHPDKDVAIIRIAGLGDKRDDGAMVAKFIEGVSSKQKMENPIVGVKKEFVKMYSDVLISNEVFILGYPNSLGDIQTGQIDYSRPLLRKGVIAGKNNSTKTLILDCPIYFGNSGGLAIEVEEVKLGERRFSIIGVVVELVPFIELSQSIHYKTINRNIENSGYSVVVPMDFVLELIQPQNK